MSSLPLLILVFGAAIVLSIISVLLWAMFSYNKMVNLLRYRDEAWSGILVQLKRRHDLIPNLVAVVKGYADHEKETLENMLQMRGTANMTVPTAENISTLTAQESAVTAALGRVFMLAQSYPELKANRNFIALQDALKETEDSIQMSRRYFNGTVREYNIKVESFPSMIIARLAAFKTLPFFELENAEETKVPKIKF